MSEYSSGRMSEYMSDNMSVGMPDRRPGVLSDRMSSKLPDATPDRLPDGMSDSMSVWTSSKCQEEWQVKLQTQCQTTCQNDCQIKCQTLWQIECQNICRIECQFVRLNHRKWYMFFIIQTAFSNELGRHGCNKIHRVAINKYTYIYIIDFGQTIISNSKNFGCQEQKQFVCNPAPGSPRYPSPHLLQPSCPEKSAACRRHHSQARLWETQCNSASPGGPQWKRRSPELREAYLQAREGSLKPKSSGRAKCPEIELSWQHLK